jgi:hypothetical protein
VYNEWFRFHPEYVVPEQLNRKGLTMLLLSNILMGSGIIVFVLTLLVTYLTVTENGTAFESVPKEDHTRTVIATYALRDTIYFLSIGLMVMAIGIKVLWT